MADGAQDTANLTAWRFRIKRKHKRGEKAFWTHTPDTEEDVIALLSRTIGTSGSFLTRQETKKYGRIVTHVAAVNDPKSGSMRRTGGAVHFFRAIYSRGTTGQAEDRVNPTKGTIARAAISADDASCPRIFASFMIRKGASHGIAVLQSNKGQSVRTLLEEAIELDGTDPKDSKAPWRLVWEPTMNPEVVRNLTMKAGAPEFTFVCDGSGKDAQARLEKAKIGRTRPSFMKLTVRHNKGFKFTKRQLEQLVHEDGVDLEGMTDIFKGPALFAAAATDITTKVDILGKTKTYSLFRPDCGAVSEEVGVLVDSDGNPTHESLWKAAWDIFTFLDEYQSDLRPAAI